ncbi:GPW/gp25 family protein [Spongiactinospora sp. TRM90649]|uniref:GPW/gp25 family protein n=1 Tax=Spongiactinospora sp. TRM90649 TaxID=3031114 RepID=UPI0023F65BBF|nr:GPW/gp25 family protein [Spongiactinospora sp. TRM90649]MDF5753128.1 GPW/gp25 family protein [Spongiactinospora sp. TRM90649]
MNVGFPYGFDATGRTATADDETHLRDLITQVLFTVPGERVMRPDFGSGLLALTFEPNSPELAATTQFLVQGALQRWLGHLIAVEAVEVTGSDGVLRVLVRYVVLRTQQRVVDEFATPGVFA